MFSLTTHPWPASAQHPSSPTRVSAVLWRWADSTRDCCELLQASTLLRSSRLLCVLWPRMPNTNAKTTPNSVLWRSACRHTRSLKVRAHVHRHDIGVGLEGSCGVLVCVLSFAQFFYSSAGIVKASHLKPMTEDVTKLQLQRSSWSSTRCANR